MLDSVTMEWLMEDAIDPKAGVSLARMTVAVGVTSELHHHTNCTETIHVLEGQINQRIGHVWMSLEAGETCVIPIGEPHQTRNIGDCKAVMMIVYSAGSRVYVAGDG